MKIGIELAEEYEVFKNQPARVIQNFLNLSEEQLTSDIKEETPVDKGKLRNSWKPKRTQDKLIVENSREYAIYVEKGTGIFKEGGGVHRIFPNTAQVLHFVTKDKSEVFATNVRGQPAHHMAEKGLIHYRKRIPNLFRASLIQAKGGK